MDSRTYNPRRGSPGSRRGDEFANAVEPIQYYLLAQFHDVGVEGLDVTLKGGRFTLDLGSGRLFGRRDFRNTVDTFRGGQILLGRGDQSLLLFYAQPLDIDGNQDQQMDTPITQTDLWGAHYSHAAFLGDVRFESYIYVEQIDTSIAGFPDLIRFTPGVRVWRSRSSGAFDFEVEATPQFRQHPQGFGYFGHAEVGYEFEHPWRPHVSAVFDIASGNGKLLVDGSTFEGFSFPSSIRTEGTTNFESLFGRLSDDFGPTGLFRSPSTDTVQRSNIISPGVRFSANPRDNVYSQLSFRGFWREDPIANFSALIFPLSPDIHEVDTFDSEIGYQLDAKVVARFLGDHLSLEAGGAMFFFGDESTEMSNIRCALPSGSFCLGPRSPRKYLYTSFTARF